MMTTRLERDIGARTNGPIAGLLQRPNFRVRLASASMPAFPDHRVVLHDDTSHPWIRVGCIQAAVSEPQRPRHITMIVTQAGHFFSSGNNDI
jgi:hypothetical protein